MSKFLHVGCGPQYKHNIKGFEEWKEIRFDIDAKVKPDIVGSLTDMSELQDASMDALFSSHNIEHLFPYEVPIALKEFFRVLNYNGYVVLTCPDLESVAKQLATGNLLEPLYTSDIGPISAIDIIYGHRGLISNGNHYMAHKTGFTYPVLSNLFSEAGFACAYGGAIPSTFAIWIVASKRNRTDEQLLALGLKHLPT